MAYYDAMRVMAYCDPLAKSGEVLKKLTYFPAKQKFERVQKKLNFPPLFVSLVIFFPKLSIGSF